MPKVTILIPIYNAELYLKECLDSVVNQTLKDIEIICINDGSTDNSLKILKEYEQRDSRIKIISKPNSGYGHTMNVGLDNATGEYIGIVESDDFASPDMFNSLYNYAKTNNVDIVKSNYYAYESTLGKNTFMEVLPKKYYGRVISPIENHEVFRVRPSIWSAIYNFKMLKENDIRFTQTPGASYQDTAFNFKVWASAKRALLIKNAYLHYRIDNSDSSVKSSSKVFCVCDEYRSIEEFLNKNVERKTQFEKLKNSLKYETYRWNLERIAPEFKYAFIRQMSIEFKQAAQEENLSKNYFSPEAWKNVNQIIRDPDLYFKQRYKSAQTNDINKLDAELKALKIELNNVYNSKSFKVGRMITAVPRKIRDILNSIKNLSK